RLQRDAGRLAHHHTHQRHAGALGAALDRARGRGGGRIRRAGRPSPVLTCGVPTPRALESLRVLDQTQVMAGPLCAMLLADMGAAVIKIEPPGGETMRSMDLEVAPGVSATFLAVNRNKRGFVLDLKRAEGVAVLNKLVATADVLIENYRPGVAARLGVDYATLSAINPRLIYCSISGFGQTGPYADRGGYNLIA